MKNLLNAFGLWLLNPNSSSIHTKADQRAYELVVGFLEKAQFDKAIVFIKKFNVGRSQAQNFLFLSALAQFGKGDFTQAWKTLLGLSNLLYMRDHKNLELEVLISLLQAKICFYTGEHNAKKTEEIFQKKLAKLKLYLTKKERNLSEDQEEEITERIYFYELEYQLNALDFSALNTIENEISESIRINMEGVTRYNFYSIDVKTRLLLSRLYKEFRVFSYNHSLSKTAPIPDNIWALVGVITGFDKPTTHYSNSGYPFLLYSALAQCKCVVDYFKPGLASKALSELLGHKMTFVARKCDFKEIKPLIPQFMLFALEK